MSGNKAPRVTMEREGAMEESFPYEIEITLPLSKDINETLCSEDTMKMMGEDFDEHVLCNDLWEDILFRLPYKLLYRAKCVSKTWMTIISNASGRRQPLTTLGLFFRDLRNFQWKYASLSEDACQSGGLSLEFLPRYKEFLPWYKEEHFRIVSTCNGLVLCSKLSYLSDVRIKNYYLCNPLTKQWIEIPEKRHLELFRVLPTALVFDPSISCHFKVIVFHMYKECRARRKKIEVFSSETGKWDVYTVRGEVPNIDALFVPLPVYLNGLVYRICDTENLLCLEIDEKRFFAIKLPEMRKSKVCERIKLYLMAIDGFLYFIRAHESGKRTQMLEIWKLEDNASGKWDLKVEVATDAIAGKLPCCSGFRWLYYATAHRPDSEAIFLARIPERNRVEEGVEIFKYNLTDKRLQKDCMYSKDDVYSMFEGFEFPGFLPFSPQPVEFFQWRQQDPS